MSLSPTATESLFAIGPDRQVVAVDDQSDYPAEAPKTDISGFKPNVEAIIAKKPDLVVLANDIDGIVAELARSASRCCWSRPRPSWTRRTTQIADLGAPPVNKAKADEMADGIKADRRARATAPKRTKSSPTTTSWTTTLLGRPPARSSARSTGCSA